MELMADDDIITPPTLANFHEDIYDAFIFMQLDGWMDR